jgi:hypothetical protein
MLSLVIYFILTGGLIAAAVTADVHGGQMATSVILATFGLASFVAWKFKQQTHGGSS